MPGVGLDLGTMNIVAARMDDGRVITKRIRDAFLDLPGAHEKRLKLSNVNFIRTSDTLRIVGDAAYDMANMFGQEVRRPLRGGVVSAGELDAQEVLAVLVKNVLGPPSAPGEPCRFSVPAPPVDVPGQDVEFHRRVLERVIQNCGYKALPSNEALAIIFSDCSEEGFSGITMSFGSGMVNICLALHTVEAFSFSVGRSGDWVDERAARAVGSTQARMCTLKETKFDLMHPQTREEQALECYYRNLIEYVIDQMIVAFDGLRGKIEPPFPIPLVVSGGTSKAAGFLQIFQEVFETRRARIPVAIKEIRAAKDPLNSVAMGLLVQAMQDVDD